MLVEELQDLSTLAKEILIMNATNDFMIIIATKDTAVYASILNISPADGQMSKKSSFLSFC